MEKVLFGDNQFFAVNHLSDEKSRQQAMRFKDIESIIGVLDQVIESGINTFMCTTHDRIGEICDHIRANPERYEGFKMYPCMPYAHKYANSVTELGVVGTLKRFVPGSIAGALVKGGLAAVKRDFVGMMKSGSMGLNISNSCNSSRAFGLS